MLDWNVLRHFAALAREGTLSGAARTLGVDHVTVARRIASLETASGLRLVDRRARAYRLTADGSRIAAIVARMEEAAFAADRAVQAAAKPGVHGEISVSAPPSMANVMLAPQLHVLREQHPGIRLRLIGETRQASLIRREADIALRLSRPTEPTLFTRKIGSFGFGLYGSPSYLRRTPEQLFAFTAYDGSMNDLPQQKWLNTFIGDREVVLRSNDLESQAGAARAGIGLALLPRFLGDPDPALQRHDVAPGSANRDIWLVVHRDLRQAPAVRSVMEFLIDCVKRHAL